MGPPPLLDQFQMPNQYPSTISQLLDSSSSDEDHFSRLYESEFGLEQMDGLYAPQNPMMQNQNFFKYKKKVKNSGREILITESDISGD